MISDSIGDLGSGLLACFIARAAVCLLVVSVNEVHGLANIFPEKSEKKENFDVSENLLVLVSRTDFSNFLEEYATSARKRLVPFLNIVHISSAKIQ